MTIFEFLSVAVSIGLALALGKLIAATPHVFAAGARDAITLDIFSHWFCRVSNIVVCVDLERQGDLELSGISAHDGQSYRAISRSALVGFRRTQGGVELERTFCQGPPMVFCCGPRDRRFCHGMNRLGGRSRSISCVGFRRARHRNWTRYRQQAKKCPRRGPCVLALVSTIRRLTALYGRLEYCKTFNKHQQGCFDDAFLNV